MFGALQDTELQEIERNTKQGGWKRLLHLFPKRGQPETNGGEYEDRLCARF